MVRRVTSPTTNILERARARREGRRLPEEDEREENVEAPEAQPDLLREAIERGEIEMRDIPISEKKHDVLSTATETSWRDAGPSDLDALRCKEQGHKFIDPATVKALERGQPKDATFESAAQTMEASVRRAARAEYDEHVARFVESGLPLQRAQEEAAHAIRVNHANRLPPPGHELHSEAGADARVRPGLPVQRERASIGDEAPATVVRDLTPERQREMEGGVRRAPVPSAE